MKEKKTGSIISPGFILSAAIVFIVVFAALIGYYILPYDANEVDLGNTMAKASAAHIFGTDYMGRDVLCRLVTGARTTLLNAVLVVLFSVVVGVPLGLMCGYYGGILDEIIMRIWDVILSIPVILLSVILVGALGRSEKNAIIAIGIVFVPMISKLAKSIMLTEKTKTYVEAAKVMGYSDMRIIFLQILPNCVATLMAEVTLDIGNAMSSLAALSFIGLGVQPPLADWGVMLNENIEMIYKAPLLALSPGIAIVMTVAALTVLSDSILVYIDPLQRRLPSIQKYKERMNKRIGGGRHE